MNLARAQLNAALVATAYSASFLSNPKALDLSGQGMELMEPITATDEDGPQTYGFVAYDHGASVVRVAIRGTDDLPEMIEDLEAIPEPAPEYGAGCMAHGWFLRLGRSMVVSSGMPLSSYLRTLGTLDLEISAHSLGSAMGTLLFGQLAPMWRGGIYLFAAASPRVGDNAFAKSFDAMPGEIERLANPFDVVTHAPTEAMGYAHVRGAVALMGADSDLLQDLDALRNHQLVTYQKYLPSTYA